MKSDCKIKSCYVVNIMRVKVVSMKQLYKITGVVGVTAAVALGWGGLGTPVSAAPAMQTQSYHAQLEPLSNSGVRGTTDLSLTDNKLTVSIQASGLEPGQVHMQHIHGLLTDGGKALCPTAAQDTNNDGFISLLEGATTYGVIKLNFTSPQTAFGPNDTMVNGTKVFAPFAGMPNMNDFPVADANGNVNFNETYTFDMSNPSAVAAYNSIKTLSNQEIVLHGATVPQNIDTVGGSTTPAYDPLFPVACADITQVPSKPIDVTPMTSKFTRSFEEANSSFQSDMTAYTTSTVTSHYFSNDSTTSEMQSFDSSFSQSNVEFHSSVSTAVEEFKTNVANGMGVNDAHSRFMSQYNDARTSYLDSLDRSKTTLNDGLKNCTHGASKDQIMDSINSMQDQYMNQLDQANSVMSSDY